MERGLELVCLILMRLRECQSRGTVSLRHSLLGQEVSGAELRGAGRHWGEIPRAELHGPVRHWGKIPGAERRGAGGDHLSHVETKIYILHYRQNAQRAERAGQATSRLASDQWGRTSWGKTSWPSLPGE